MKKFFLIIFILFDVLVIAASALFLYSRIKTTRNDGMSTTMSPVPVSEPAPGAPPASTAPLATSTMGAAPGASVPEAAAVSSGARKILFSYRNSKSRKIMIRADFTGWRAEPMLKDPASNKWTYMATLEPGEYAYCFSVDDKSIRDPANKRTKQVGKTRVSSIIVQPAAPPH